MYRCRQCGWDASAEVQAEIDQVADSLSPGQTPQGMYEYFEQRYVCKACQAGTRAAPKQAHDASSSDEVPAAASDQFKRRYQHKIGLDELVRILTLVNSPPGFRSSPRPGDRRDQHFDSWFDGGAITGETGGMSEYWFADGVRLDWAGLAPRLFLKIEWPDGRSVRIEQDRPVPAEEAAPAATSGSRKAIDRYEVTGILGEGACGTVYAGVDPASRRKVAIKTALKSAHDADTVACNARSLLREVLAGERVKHAAIVQALEFGEDADMHYAVIEYVDARKLANVLDADQRFRIGDVVTMMGDVCAALEAAHEAGIVHCNLNPGNVMIASDGSARLTDFGLARLSGLESMNEPEMVPDRTYPVLGVPEYKSPEVVSGDVIDRRADVFSAGILLYQLLTGEKPFTGASPWTVARKILEDNPSAPSSLNSSVSHYFDAVVAKALAKDPAQRYQSALELDGALQAAMWKSGPGS